MGQAREAMDRVTAAVMRNDMEALRAAYAPDAVAETPDAGTLRGRDAIVEYLASFARAFPDASFELMTTLEIDDTAIDEAYFMGTNTGDLVGPGGERIPATGKRVRMRECDLATVRGGLITRHSFYFDQLELLGQLGLAGEAPPGEGRLTTA